jgi:ribosomal 50S subunit-recycling heat shock protein
MKPIGKVSHYYDKAGVAIVELQDALKVGDRIRIERGENSFEQEVASMQVEYKPVQEAKKGSLVVLLEEGE